MAEHTTVFITATTPGVGTRTYTESGKKTSMNVNSLTANTEYIANAEYEDPNGVVIQTSQGYTFRTLPAGTLSISSEQWINNNDGRGSTLTFNYISTYAISSIQVQVGGAGGTIYQCTISGDTATASLPYFAPGTQRTMEFTLIDIYTEQNVIGRIMTLQPSMESTPFYVELANGGSGTVALNRASGSGSPSLVYSYNLSTWTSVSIGTSISLDSSNPRVYFKCSPSAGTQRFNSASRICKFSSTGSSQKIGGNLAFLIDQSGGALVEAYDFISLFSSNTIITSAEKLYMGWTNLQAGINPADECFKNMFNGCTSLIIAPSLPATSLSSSCYTYMFANCTSLTQPPSLPATTLSKACYNSMFMGCTSLTTAPELPAQRVNSDTCYQNMFSGCTNLNYVKVGATYWDPYQTISWLSNVSSTGTFVKPSSLVIGTGIGEISRDVDGIPRDWTVVAY